MSDDFETTAVTTVEDVLRLDKKADQSIKWLKSRLKILLFQEAQEVQ